ncbi:MAG: hypothetical protein ABI333_07520, partial [bacterium]
ERLQALTGYWAAKYGVRIEWSGFTGRVSGKVHGVKFDGIMQVDGDRLWADIKTGFLAERLGGRKYVQGKLDDYLDPAHALPDLRARVP